MRARPPMRQPGARMSTTGTTNTGPEGGVASRSRAVRSYGMHHEVKPIIAGAAVLASHRGSAPHTGAAGSSIMSTKQADMLAHRRAVRTRRIVGRNPY